MGIQDPLETGLEGVTVNLVSSSGDIVASTTTDTSGNYSFTGVPDNATYTVEISDIDSVSLVAPAERRSGRGRRVLDL